VRVATNAWRRLHASVLPKTCCTSSKGLTPPPHTHTLCDPPPPHTHTATPPKPPTHRMRRSTAGWCCAGVHQCRGCVHADVLPAFASQT
jgi:hypothetical protein